MWQRVLTWKETIVRIESNVRLPLHRLGKHVRTEPTCQGRGDRLLEEEPDVGTLARARSFDRDGQTQLAARVGKRLRIVTPAGLVEVDGKKETGLVLQERIDRRDEGLPLGVQSRQVPANNVVWDR